MVYEITRENTRIKNYVATDSDGIHEFSAECKRTDASKNFRSASVKVSANGGSIWSYVGNENVGARLTHKSSREGLSSFNIPKEINAAFAKTYPAYKNILQLSRTEQGLPEEIVPAWQTRNFLVGPHGTTRQANPSAVLDIPEPWHRPPDLNLSPIPFAQTPNQNSNASFASYLAPPEDGDRSAASPSGGVFGYPDQTSQTEMDKYR